MLYYKSVVYLISTGIKRQSLLLCILFQKIKRNLSYEKSDKKVVVSANLIGTLSLFKPKRKYLVMKETVLKVKMKQ